MGLKTDGVFVRVGYTDSLLLYHYGTIMGMLDWYSGLLGYDSSKLKPEALATLDYQGNIVWSKPKFVSVPGSYSDKIQLLPKSPNEAMLKATEKYNLECAPACLYFSGNPSKFLQGHNVFGPSVKDLGPILTEAVRRMPADVRPGDADSILFPALSRNRVDITAHVAFGSHSEVHQYLTFVGNASRSRQGRAMVSGKTVYWQKESTRWALKMYCKFCELGVHPPPRGDFKLLEELRLYTEGQLRIELCLRTPELQNKGTLDESLIWEYLNNLTVSKMKVQETEKKKIPNLPRGVILSFVQWQSGGDMPTLLPHNTFYRHRRMILAQTGIDISMSCTPEVLKSTDIDQDWLKAHQIKDIPSMFQGLLFKPESSNITWEKN